MKTGSPVASYIILRSHYLGKRWGQYGPRNQHVGLVNDCTNLIPAKLRSRSIASWDRLSLQDVIVPHLQAGGLSIRTLLDAHTHPSNVRLIAFSQNTLVHWPGGIRMTPTFRDKLTEQNEMSAIECRTRSSLRSGYPTLYLLQSKANSRTWPQAESSFQSESAKS